MNYSAIWVIVRTNQRQALVGRLRPSPAYAWTRIEPRLLPDGLRFVLVIVAFPSVPSMNGCDVDVWWEACDERCMMSDIWWERIVVGLKVKMRIEWCGIEWCKIRWCSKIKQQIHTALSAAAASVAVSCRSTPGSLTPWHFSPKGPCKWGPVKWE